jgi:6-phosphogluconolactonase
MRRLVAYVGSYGAAPGTKGGGIYCLAVADTGARLELVGHTPKPIDAGYLAYAPDTSTLYAVDERKTDGRGPVHPPAAVWAFAVDRASGELTLCNRQLAPGPRPTFLSYSARYRLLISANHGDFQHVEKVVRQSHGGWATDYFYDDSTVCAFDIEADGAIGALRDVHVFQGQGMDPNNSPQNGGHAQSNPHAHCAVVDPSGDWLLVCDKGTDRIYAFRLGAPLEPVFTLQMTPQTGPRHLAFDPITGLAYATCEISSELASLRFDPASGALTLLGKILTMGPEHQRLNEPAEVRVYPSGGVVYVNNRGEDTLAWFRVAPDGGIERAGAVPLAPSIHPGLAARSFSFDPSGAFLLIADRPAHRVRSYAVDAATGALSWQADIGVPDPAFIEFVELQGASDGR